MKKISLFSVKSPHTATEDEEEDVSYRSFVPGLHLAAVLYKALSCPLFSLKALSPFLSSCQPGSVL